MDLLQREGQYPLPPQAPKTLGVEFSGTVEKLAPNAESEFKVGDEVFGLAYGGQSLSTAKLVKELTNIQKVHMPSISQCQRICSSTNPLTCPGKRLQVSQRYYRLIVETPGPITLTIVTDVDNCPPSDVPHWRI